MNIKNNSTVLLAGVLGLLAVGCTGPNEPAETEGNLVTFTCPGGETIEAIFPAELGGDVTVSLPDQEAMTLPAVEAASGARYSDGSTTFWEQGGEAMVEVGDEVVLQNCIAE